MSIEQIIVYCILGFIIGMLLPHITSLLWSKIKRKDILREKIRSISEELETPHTIDTTYVVIRPETILRLAKYTIIYNITEAETKALLHAGFIQRAGGGYIVNTQAVAEYISQLKNIEINETEIDEEVGIYLLSRFGIANLIIYKISREMGLICIYRLGSTRLTEKIAMEPAFADNLFMIGTKTTLSVDGMNLVIIPEGQYFFIIEILPSANPDNIINAFSRIKLPENTEQIRDILLSL